jgi:hypothetical protein
MATTYDISSTQSIQFMSGNKVYVAEAVLDFSERNMASTETVKLLTIPANTLVLDVVYQVLTEEGATLTVDLGDTGTAALFATAVDCNDDSVHANTALAAPVYYAAANMLAATCNNDGANTAKLLVKIACVDASDSKDDY